MDSSILVFDFGSQFSHLIGNKIRNLGIYSEILCPSTDIESIKIKKPVGIILSGGPESVFSKNAIKIDEKIFDLGVPILGICYGHHLIANFFEGKIETIQKEFGKSEVEHNQGSELFLNIPQKSIFWMNHGDSVTQLPKNFKITGKTKECNIASYEDFEKKIYSVQFHPEVSHSEHGKQLIENFTKICKCKKNWIIEDRIKTILKEIKERAKNKKVFMMVSGGVDSSVAFSLLTKSIGEERVFGLFVDTGLLRKNEQLSVKNMISDKFKNLHIANESEHFIKKLKKIHDPEQKREIIGNTFLEIQKKYIKKLNLNPEEWLLGQGTIYPDTIETGVTKNSNKIKTHHNRVPEIEMLIKENKIIEPLSEFYKNEVREIGYKIGLTEELIERHPFPGPGLGVRIICQDEQSYENFNELESKIENNFNIKCKILNMKSVGVQGDGRSYKNPLVIFDEQLEKIKDISNTIINQNNEINRVIFSLSNAKKINIFYSNLEISQENVRILQDADFITQKIIEKHKLKNKVWQFPVVLSPLGSKKNTYSIVLRPIMSENGMTANVVFFNQEILKEFNNEILKCNEKISSVFLDITSKPPGTIEWE